MKNLIEGENTYIVVGSKPWNQRVFKTCLSKLSGNWMFADSRAALSLNEVRKINPRYIFFLHWSWKVPEELINDFECICFHMADVPFGRGGSPLQNLIVRGHQSTKLTALRMTHEFDAGPVYLKKELSLLGNAEEIYIRATHLSATMIEHIIQEQPVPVPQSGDVVLFKRRKSQESEIPQVASLEQLHDFIRMLDAEGYPKAFLQHQGFRYEFSRVALYDGRLIADVRITPIGEDIK